MSITKTVVVPAEISSTRGKTCSASGPAESDDDEEALTKSESTSALVVFDIGYSTSYQCPVLYVRFESIGGSPPLPSAALQTIVPSVSRSQIDAVGPIGGISLTVRARDRGDYVAD